MTTISNNSDFDYIKARFSNSEYTNNGITSTSNPAASLMYVGDKLDQTNNGISELVNKSTSQIALNKIIQQTGLGIESKISETNYLIQELIYRTEDIFHAQRDYSEAVRSSVALKYSQTDESAQAMADQMYGAFRKVVSGEGGSAMAHLQSPLFAIQESLQGVLARVNVFSSKSTEEALFQAGNPESKLLQAVEGISKSYGLTYKTARILSTPAKSIVQRAGQNAPLAIAMAQFSVQQNIADSLLAIRKFGFGINDSSLKQKSSPDGPSLLETLQNMPHIGQAINLLTDIVTAKPIRSLIETGFDTGSKIISGIGKVGEFLNPINVISKYQKFRDGAETTTDEDGNVIKQGLLSQLSSTVVSKTLDNIGNKLGASIDNNALNEELLKRFNLDKNDQEKANIFLSNEFPKISEAARVIALQQLEIQEKQLTALNEISRVLGGSAVSTTKTDIEERIFRADTGNYETRARVAEIDKQLAEAKLELIKREDSNRSWAANFFNEKFDNGKPRLDDKGNVTSIGSIADYEVEKKDASGNVMRDSDGNAIMETRSVILDLERDAEKLLIDQNKLREQQFNDELLRVKQEEIAALEAKKARDKAGKTALKILKTAGITYVALNPLDAIALVAKLGLGTVDLAASAVSTAASAATSVAGMGVDVGINAVTGIGHMLTPDFILESGIDTAAESLDLASQAFLDGTGSIDAVTFAASELAQQQAESMMSLGQMFSVGLLGAVGAGGATLAAQAIDVDFRKVASLLTSLSSDTLAEFDKQIADNPNISIYDALKKAVEKTKDDFDISTLDTAFGDDVEKLIKAYRSNTDSTYDVFKELVQAKVDKYREDEKLIDSLNTSAVDEFKLRQDALNSANINTVSSRVSTDTSVVANPDKSIVNQQLDVQIEIRDLIKQLYDSESVIQPEIKDLISKFQVDAKEQLNVSNIIKDILNNNKLNDNDLSNNEVSNFTGAINNLGHALNDSNYTDFAVNFRAKGGPLDAGDVSVINEESSEIITVGQNSYVTSGPKTLTLLQESVKWGVENATTQIESVSLLSKIYNFLLNKSTASNSSDSNSTASTRSFNPLDLFKDFSISFNTGLLEWLRKDRSFFDGLFKDFNVKFNTGLLEWLMKDRSFFDGLFKDFNVTKDSKIQTETESIFNGLFSNINTVLKTKFNAIFKNTTKLDLNPIIDGISNIGLMFSRVFDSVVNNVKKINSFFSPIITSISKGLSTVFSSVTKNITKYAAASISTVKNAISDLYSSIADKFKNLDLNLSGKWDSFKSTALELMESMAEKAKSVRDAIGKQASKVMDLIKSPFKGIINKYNEIKESVKNKISSIMDLPGKALKKVGSVVKGIGSSIGNVVGGMTIKKPLFDIKDEVHTTNMLLAKLTFITENIHDKIPELTKTEKIKSKTSSIADKLKQFESDDTKDEAVEREKQDLVQQNKQTELLQELVRGTKVETKKPDEEKGFFGNLLEHAKDIILSGLGLSGLGRSLTGGISRIGGVLAKSLGWVGKKVPVIAIALGAFDIIKDAVSGFMSGDGILDSIWQGIKGIFSTGDGSGGFGSMMKGMGKGAAIGAAIASAIPIPIVNWLVGGAIGSVVGGIFGFIGFDKVSDYFKEIQTEYIDPAMDFLMTPFRMIGDLISNLTKKIKDKVKALFSILPDWANPFVDDKTVLNEDTDSELVNNVSKMSDEEFNDAVAVANKDQRQLLLQARAKSQEKPVSTANVPPKKAILPNTEKGNKLVKGVERLSDEQFNEVIAKSDKNERQFLLQARAKSKETPVATANVPPKVGKVINTSATSQTRILSASEIKERDKRRAERRKKVDQQIDFARNNAKGLDRSKLVSAKNKDKFKDTKGLNTPAVNWLQSQSFKDFGMAFTATNEGFRSYPYLDSEGNATVGYGHLLNKGPIKEKDKHEWDITTLNNMYMSDYAEHAIAASKNIPNFNKMSDDGKVAMSDLTFNMGKVWSSGWPGFTKAVTNEDTEKMTRSLENSKWARQVGIRKDKVISLVKNAFTGGPSKEDEEAISDINKMPATAAGGEVTEEDQTKTDQKPESGIPTIPTNKSPDSTEATDTDKLNSQSSTTPDSSILENSVTEDQSPLTKPAIDTVSTPAIAKEKELYKVKPYKAPEALTGPSNISDESNKPLYKVKPYKAPEALTGPSNISEESNKPLYKVKPYIDKSKTSNTANNPAYLSEMSKRATKMFNEDQYHSIHDTSALDTTTSLKENARQYIVESAALDYTDNSDTDTTIKKSDTPINIQQMHNDRANMPKPDTTHRQDHNDEQMQQLDSLHRVIDKLFSEVDWVINEKMYNMATKQSTLFV